MNLLSCWLTLMKAMPDFGSTEPALICALTYALPKSHPTPMTSPVDFISGPRIVSTPGNLANGNTGDFTQYCFTFSSAGRSKSASFLPNHQPSGDLGQRHAGRFADKRNGS